MVGGKTHLSGQLLYFAAESSINQAFLRLAVDFLEEQVEDGRIGLDEFDFAGNHDIFE